VLGANTRRARATSSRARGLPSLERSGPWSVLPRKRSAPGDEPARDGSRLAGLRCGDALVRPTQPASLDAGEQWGASSHSRARNDGSQGVPACRIRLQKSTNDAEASRGALRWQGSARTGAQPEPRPQGRGEGSKRVESGPPWQQNHDARKGSSLAPERASRGEGLRPMEGTLGHSFSSSRSRGWVGDGLGGPRQGSWSASSRGSRRGGDRGVRGSVRTHGDGKTTPAAVTLDGELCDPPKRIALP